MPYTLICGLILNVIIDTKDVESDGTHTHLLRTDFVPAKHCPGQKGVVAANHNPVFISYTAPVGLGKEGDVLKIMLDAECSEGRGVDEEMSDKTNSWITYRSWICTATSLKVLRGPQ